MGGAVAHFALQASHASLWSAPLRPPGGRQIDRSRRMRQEIQTFVDEIKQAIGLLRRHL
jgi:hypothetical protein